MLSSDIVHSSPTPQVILRFESAPSGETFLARRFVTYPFFLTAPFRLDRTPAGMLTTILQSVSGGVYEREQLALSLTAGRNAQAHCTTQSATVVHSMAPEGAASQLVTIHAASGSFVEYLPDPLILFPDASLRTALNVEVEDDTTVIFSDAFLSHDPDARGRHFRSLFSETLVQHADGRRLCADRFTISGDDWRFALSAKQQSYSACGTVWIITSQCVTSCGLFCGTDWAVSQGSTLASPLCRIVPEYGAGCWQLMRLCSTEASSPLGAPPAWC